MGPVERVETEGTHQGLDDRLDLLDSVNELFRKYPHFSSMNENERKGIAGCLGKGKVEVDWGVFGSMIGAGEFNQQIGLNNKHISIALDKIPSVGEITKKHYENFLDEFKEALSKKIWIAPASRLLAMKRPDVFVCVNSKNKKKLCKAFGIKQSGMTYERYWDEIIERIRNSDWWKSQQPEDKREIRIWKGRSAVLDAIYYE